MADPVNLDIIQGATFNLSVTWTSGGATPVPQPLAGYRAHMQIRRRAGDPNILIDLRSDSATPTITLEPPDDTNTPQTGVVQLSIPATETANLTRNCAYDLFLIRESDPTQAVRLIFGTVTVERAVTVG